MTTLSLTIVNIDADTSHVESLTIADASEIDGILASRGDYLAEGPTFTIDDDDAVTYHATITI